MNTKAYEIGKKDGAQMAWEAKEQGQKIRPGSAQNFDESLINAIGGAATAKLFGVELDTPEWQDAIESYDIGAGKAWDAAASEADSPAA